MKILITGASGLIGSELVQDLVLKKHKIVVLTRNIAKTLHRTTFFPVVPILLKWFYGDMSSLLLDDQKIVPQKLLELKHLFLYPNIHSLWFDYLKAHSPDQKWCGMFEK